MKSQTKQLLTSPIINQIQIAILLLTICFTAIKIEFNWFYYFPLVLVALLSLVNIFFLVEDFEDINPDEEGGLAELLAMQIVPKVLGIASFISLTGVIFYHKDFQGASKLIFIGVTTIITALIIFFFASHKGASRSQQLRGLIYKSAFFSSYQVLPSLSSTTILPILC
jgi:hypothetical protein